VEAQTSQWGVNPRLCGGADWSIGRGASLGKPSNHRPYLGDWPHNTPCWSRTTEAENKQKSNRCTKQKIVDCHMTPLTALHILVQQLKADTQTSLQSKTGPTVARVSITLLSTCSLSRCEQCCQRHRVSSRLFAKSPLQSPPPM